MEQHTCLVTFEHVSAADANRYASELRTLLLDAAPDVEVTRKRDDPSAQDFGTTLILVLGTPAIVMLATALKDWLIRSRITVKIRAADGTSMEVSGTSLTPTAQSKLVGEIAEAFSRKS